MSGPVRDRYELSPALAIAPSLALLVLAECARVPSSQLGAESALWLSLYAAGRAVRMLACDVGFQLALVLLAAVSGKLVVRAGLVMLACAVPVAAAYRGLVEEPAFVGYLPLIAGLGLVWLYLLGLAGWLVAAGEGERRARWLRDVWMLGGLIGAVGACVANLRVYPDDYVTLHATALHASYLLLHGAITLALLRAAPRVRRLLEPRVVLAALAPFALAGAAYAVLPNVPAARPAFLADTTLGRSTLVPGRDAEPIAPRSVRLADPVATFLEHGALPALPARFSLGDYDVLFVVSETTRFDQTSLADPRLRTTPKLLAWTRAQHAFTFSRAYAPSSATAQSMSSVFSMTFPSATRWQVWRKRWHGELSPSALTVPELFQAAGRFTFWAGHDYLRMFGEGILGFEQGFSRVQRVLARRTSTSTDAKIANATIRNLREARRNRQPFFGWVFFVSPHARYVAHGYRMPKETDLDRYRQELRYVDDQLARVLAEVDADPLARPTIVLYAGDHGEQFFEHGGTDHSRNLYSESIHVPLVVRIPRLGGGAVEKPVSTLQLFPWLLLHGDAAMQAAARARIERELAPLADLTRGAVLSELLGADRMLATLVYEDRKLEYDFATGKYRAFDLVHDPGELHDLTQSDSARARALRPPLDAFRALRASVRTFDVAPTRARARVAAAPARR